MRSVTVILGGVTYTVNQLPMRAEAAWRKEVQALIEPALALMRDYEHLEFDGPADMAAFLGSLAPMLLDAPDAMLDILLGYSPELARHADRIRDTCYSDEVLAALREVAAIAFPLAGELARFGKISAASGANGEAPKLSQTTLTS